MRKPGSVGRRSSDRGDDGDDRRARSDRRLPRAPRGRRRARHATRSRRRSRSSRPSRAPELDVGSEVDGRYRIIELIGEGGMGKVYLAEHVEIGKRVALKVLHPSYSRMPDLVERFRREARAASKIGHPNIVDVTDFGATADGSVYFVMEYLEGVELGSVIEREGALDVARALRITGQICRALSAAHREGIIHRDLKPENIFLITRDGEADVVKVLDFGIAKTTEAEAARERRLTSPGMAMGTPEYMAPEQAAGRPADARTDIYSLGAIMYEMVTGAAAVLRRQLHGDPDEEGDAGSAAADQRARGSAAAGQRARDRGDGAQSRRSPAVDGRARVRAQQVPRRAAASRSRRSSA